jgi:DNA repair exonuclease SbcCD ATPase subunit
MAKATKIVRLEAENVKRLRAVSIEPDGSLVVISGRNGQGKSSVLDAIWMALGGRRAMPRRPVRDGAEEASIRLELDEMVVERKIKPDGQSSLVVSSKDGARYSSPQALLDGLVAGLSFDPLAFARMSAKEQREVLAKLVGLDTRDLEAERERVFQERTVINREVKRLEGEISGVPHHPNAPEGEVNVAELAEELRAAEVAHGKVELAEREVSKAQEAHAQALEQAAALRVEIGELEAKLASLRERLTRGEQGVIPTRETALTSARARIEELRAAAPDRDAIAARLASVEHLNRDVRDNRRREELKAKHGAVEKKARELTTKIDDLDTAKAARIASASYPLPGLAVDDEGVILNALPFEQASSAEQLRASVAIGLALQPTLRVLLVRDGSLLDADSLRLLGELAHEAGAQVWLETVGAREVGVVIEDGAVVGAPVQEARP